MCEIIVICSDSLFIALYKISSDFKRLITAYFQKKCFSHKNHIMYQTKTLAVC